MYEKVSTDLSFVDREKAVVEFWKEKDIFRPFETSKEDGIGLGLNIVKDIVEKYHFFSDVSRSATMKQLPPTKMKSFLLLSSLAFCSAFSTLG